jgi:hypothetical protein
MQARFPAYVLMLLLPVVTARASVLTPGEDPGQFGLSAYVHNDSELPYPQSGQVGDGFIRYESAWFDKELAAWQAWAACIDAAGDCDALYEEVMAGDPGGEHGVSFDDDSFTLDMDGLVQSARFDMFDVVFTQADIKYFRNTFGVDGDFIGTVLELQTPGGDRLYFGAGDEDVQFNFDIAGNYASCSNGYCYASAPDGSSTEDIYYDFSIDPEPAESAPEPPTILLWLMALAGLLTYRHGIRPACPKAIDYARVTSRTHVSPLIAPDQPSAVTASNAT